MNVTSDILHTFNSISLEEMSKVKLLDRMDKKYMLHADQLPEILALLRNDYFVLEIAQKNMRRTQPLISTLPITRCTQNITTEN